MSSSRMVMQRNLEDLFTWRKIELMCEASVNFPLADMWWRLWVRPILNVIKQNLTLTPTLEWEVLTLNLSVSSLMNSNCCLCWSTWLSRHWITLLTFNKMLWLVDHLASSLLDPNQWWNNWCEIVLWSVQLGVIPCHVIVSQRIAIADGLFNLTSWCETANTTCQDEFFWTFNTSRSRRTICLLTETKNSNMCFNTRRWLLKVNRQPAVPQSSDR